MYYELYVDSLFLVNFVMNLYLLLLVNQSTFRTATRIRLVLGAALGAVLYFLPFFCVGGQWLRLTLGTSLGVIAMIVVTFRVRSIRSFFKILERLLMYSILMGGAMLLSVGRFSWLEERIMGVWGVLGMGALFYLLFTYLAEHRTQLSSLCKVTLVCRGNRITMTALVDSGNSLMEPISGKPVSIIEKSIIPYLWEEEPVFYRAIPYHSIGKQRGILKGYLVPEIRIETCGTTKICKDIYVAVCEEYVTSEAKMILNPGLLSESNKVQRRRKRTSKERYGYYYDIESGSPG